MSIKCRFMKISCTVHIRNGEIIIKLGKLITGSHIISVIISSAKQIKTSINPMRYYNWYYLIYEVEVMSQTRNFCSLYLALLYCKNLFFITSEIHYHFTHSKYSYVVCSIFSLWKILNVYVNSSRILGWIPAFFTFWKLSFQGTSEIYYGDTVHINHLNKL